MSEAARRRHIQAQAQMALLGAQVAGAERSIDRHGSEGGGEQTTAGNREIGGSPPTLR
jgi:hypothetical protein